MEFPFASFEYRIACACLCPGHRRENRGRSPMDLSRAFLVSAFRISEAHFYFVYGFLARGSRVLGKERIIQANSRALCRHHGHGKHVFDTSARRGHVGSHHGHGPRNVLSWRNTRVAYIRFDRAWVCLPCGSRCDKTLPMAQARGILRSVV